MQNMDISQFGYSGGFGSSFRPYTSKEIEDQERVNAYRYYLQKQWADKIINPKAGSIGMDMFTNWGGGTNGGYGSGGSGAGGFGSGYNKFGNWSTMGTAPRFPYSGSI